MNINNAEDQLYPVLPNQNNNSNSISSNNANAHRSIDVEKVPLLEKPNQATYNPQRSSQPTFVYVLPSQQPQQQQQPVYPRYHPHNVYCYAKKSRSNCCCVCTALCCCLLVLIGTVVGAVFGFLAMKCLQMNYSTTLEYTNFQQNFTTVSLQVGHANLYVSQNSSVDQLTIRIVKKASASELLSNDTVSISSDPYSDTLFVALHDGAVWWNTITICQTTDVYVDFPVTNDTLPNLLLSTEDGNIVVNFLNSVSIPNVLSASSTNGNVGIDTTTQIYCPSIHVQTTNGDISVNAVTTSSLISGSTNGNIILGSIQYNFGSGNLSVHTTNGNIDQISIYGRNIKVPGCGEQNAFQGQVSTTNGNVDLVLSGYCGMFSLSTNHGNLYAAGPNVTKIQDSTYSQAGYVGVQSTTKDMVASTSNGNAYITFEL